MFTVSNFQLGMWNKPYFEGAIIVKGEERQQFIITKDDVMHKTSGGFENTISNRYYQSIRLTRICLPDDQPLLYINPVSPNGISITDFSVDPRAAVVCSKPVFKIKRKPEMYMKDFFIVHKLAPTATLRTIKFQGSMYTYEEYSAYQQGEGSAEQVLQDLLDRKWSSYLCELPVLEDRGAVNVAELSIRERSILVQSIKNTMTRLDMTKGFR